MEVVANGELSLAELLAVLVAAPVKGLGVQRKLTEEDKITWLR